MVQAGLGPAVAAVFLPPASFGENLETSTIQNIVSDTVQPPEEFTAQYVSEVSIYSCLDSFVCFATLCCSISLLKTCFKIIIHFAAHMLGAPDVAFVTKHIGASVVHSWLPGVLWGMLGGFRLPIDSVSTPLPHLPFYLWLHLP